MANENENKILELTKLLAQRDQEISHFKGEIQRMNSQLEVLISDLSHELKWVGLIQKALSPTQLPNIPGFEFSTKFLAGTQTGGDYFDIFEHDDRLKFGILLSASSGYSMSALFLSVLMKLAGKMEARKGTSPSQALQLLKQEMVPNMKTKDSAEILYGYVDRRNFEFKYCSLGNIFAFHQIHGQGNLVRLESSTGPLGANHVENLMDQSVQLGPKDRLILCTSGIVLTSEEIQNSIIRAPSTGVHAVRNEILLQAEKKSAEVARDVTVIVLEVSDRVIKLAK